MAKQSKSQDIMQYDDYKSLLNDLSESTRHHLSAISFPVERGLKIEQLDGKNCIFFRIDELSVQEQFILRQDLETVFASITDKNFMLAYFVSGKPTGIEIFIGVVRQVESSGDTFNYSKLLESQLNGNVSGIKLQKINNTQLDEQVIQPLKKSKYYGLVTGIPSLTIDEQANSQGKVINQGIDKLARTLIDEEWQMLIIAEPTKINEVQDCIDELFDLSSKLHPAVSQSNQYGFNAGVSDNVTDTTSHGESSSVTKGENSSTTEGASYSKTKGENHNKTKGENYSTTQGENYNETHGMNTNTSQAIAQGKSSGHSITHNIETLNKRLERIYSYINETHLTRLEQGRSNGLFKTAIYLSATRSATYERLVSVFMAVFQGNQSYFNPLKVQKIHLGDGGIYQLFSINWQPRNISTEALLVNSTPYQDGRQAHATWLNSAELSLLAGLPSREVCGIKLRKNVDFAVNPNQPDEEGFELGKIILNGRQLNHNKLQLDKKLLNQHIFISGVTGAGKTTTCQQLLLKSKLPFLVIEPAKTEYRSLYKLDESIQYYTLNNEKVSPFRFNPFELLPSEQLLSHIDILKATFATVFPMEASMPYLIEEAIVRSYEAKGWDIHTTQNFLYSEPFNSDGACFPIMSEMLEELERVIESKKFGLELQEKYRGSLISRLDNLTIGSKGRMLNTRRSIDIMALLEQKVVIELDELKDEQDKALIMGLLIGRVAEAVKYKHKQNHQFKHLTLIEEAHRLLEKPQANDDGAKKMGVSLFVNLLAEVRKYGEGLIIADQIPNKLAPEVLKNTNTKIIHRLFAADDRHAIGETVGLDEEQIDFLPMLKAGEAVVYSAGWHGAVRMQVNQINDTNAKELDEKEIIERSKQQVYQQRKTLYPKLSRLCQNISQDEFYQFIQEGSYVLGLWTNWYHKIQRDIGSVKAKKLLEYMQCHLDKFYNEWCGKLSLSLDKNMDNQAIKQVIDGYLSALFVDIAPIAYLEDKISEKYSVEQVIGCLFWLYHQSKLDTQICCDEDLGLGRGRLVQDILTRIFKNLHSV